MFLHSVPSAKSRYHEVKRPQPGELINDGVRLNIRPIMSVSDIGKKKGAGILRFKPNIKWNKDRGKGVESVLWYKLGLEYDESEGSGVNDHHLSLEEKEAARNDKIT